MHPCLFKTLTDFTKRKKKTMVIWYQFSVYSIKLSERICFITLEKEKNI